MAVNPNAISDRLFHAYAHPLLKSRFYLAVAAAVLLLPLMAAATAALVAPLLALIFWIASRAAFARLLGGAILVSSVNHPRVNAIVEGMNAKLGYSRPLHVFVRDRDDFSVSMPRIPFGRAIILSSGLLDACVSDDELRWVIGRHIGHLRARRQLGALGWVIEAARKFFVFNVFLNPCERAIAYTGDRLALAAMGGDIASAVSAMTRLLAGRRLAGSIHLEGVVDQQRRLRGSSFAFLARAFSPCPHATSRCVDLIVFAKAHFPVQYAGFEAANPGLPDDLASLAASPFSAVPPTREGREPVGAPPRGWLVAGATAAAVAVAALIAWNGVAERRDRYAFQPPAAAPAFPSPANLIMPHSVPAAAGIDSPQAIPAIPASAAPPLPPHVHRNAAGEYAPDNGCRWISEAPADFRVRCN